MCTGGVHRWGARAVTRCRLEATRKFGSPPGVSGSWVSATPPLAVSLTLSPIKMGRESKERKQRKKAKKENKERKKAKKEDKERKQRKKTKKGSKERKQRKEAIEYVSETTNGA